MTDHGARMPRLWGAEERALIDLLRNVLGDTLSADQIHFLLSPIVAGDLPRETSVALWHLVNAVEGRHQTHEALDKGLMASPQAALRSFHVVEPLLAKEVALDTASQRFVIRIQDAQGKGIRATFPASEDSIACHSWIAGEANTGLWCEVGSSYDRQLMTLVSMALEADRTSSFEKLNLKVLLNVRRTRILESDAR